MTDPNQEEETTEPDQEEEMTDPNQETNQEPSTAFTPIAQWMTHGTSPNHSNHRHYGTGFPLQRNDSGQTGGQNRVIAVDPARNP